MEMRNEMELLHEDYDKRIEVLALDLDGTLTNSKKEITPHTIETLQRAIAAGVHVVLASGRPLVGITKLAEKLNLYELGGFILAYNGAQIIDLKSGKEIVSAVIPEQYYQEIYDAAVKIAGVSIISYLDGSIYSETPEDPYVQKETFCCGVPVQKTENLVAELKAPVHKFLIPGEPAKLARAADYLRKQFNGVLSVTYSEPYFLEVMTVGIHKAASLEHILHYLHTDRTHLMACGDGMNDVEMLKFAGLSVAMGNACEAAKACARVVTDTNDNDGVAKAVERYILRA